MANLPLPGSSWNIEERLLNPIAYMIVRYCAWLMAFVLVGGAMPCWAFVLSESSATTSRWAGTSHGSTGAVGTPATLTWSLVPDGTGTAELNPINQSPSNLLANLDATFGAGAGGTNYTNRPWFALFDQSFERWEDLSGLTFQYEPNDDGITHNNGLGQIGVRGDIRIAGIGLDGSLGTIAYNYFPGGGGDMAIDTQDMGFFSNSTSNFLQLRNTIMHELGHGLGLDHTESNSSDMLLETTISTTFDGPQHDDLRGIHWMYGDALEKTNGGLGNNVSAHATALGTLAAGGSLAIGTAGNGTVIGATETDLVSIANLNDTDYFSFTTVAPVTLDLIMTPRGATYDQGTSTLFDTTASSDLSLTLFDTDGSTILAQSASGAAGVAESLNGQSLLAPGEYFVRVTMEDDPSTADEVVQFYQLDLSAQAMGPLLAGDYNLNGVVDAADYVLWRDTLGQTGLALFSGADGDGDGQIGSGDYTVWSGQFGATVSVTTAVPEPTSLGLFLTWSLLWARWKTTSGALWHTS